MKSVWLVKLEREPVRGTYGHFVSSLRWGWLAAVSFDEESSEIHE